MTRGLAGVARIASAITVHAARARRHDAHG